jgi:AGZA family xanthine/uracil permease-like MFS transporter
LKCGGLVRFEYSSQVRRKRIIESAAGVAAGARTGLSNVAVAGLFLLATFCSPLATAIPAYPTAPALILVGVLMTQSIAQNRLAGIQ